MPSAALVATVQVNLEGREADPQQLEESCCQADTCGSPKLTFCCELLNLEVFLPSSENEDATNSPLLATGKIE